MDIDDITKIANSKRLTTDADKLREKVTKEKEEIIKLKVAQDTAFWDLKEKSQQVQENYDRLQQNMAELQMQHEAVKSKYQEELRKRPELLNKLSTTRKICDVLQESSERLRETLARCKADGATLYNAFNKSAEQLREHRLREVQLDAKIKQQVESLQEKGALLDKHFSQMVEHLKNEKQQVDGQLAEARAHLAAAQDRNNDLLSKLGDTNRELDQYKHHMERKDDIISHQQLEIKRLADENNTQSSNAKKSLEQKDKQIQEATDAVQSLKGVVMNQEQYIKNIGDERNALQEKVADLEEEQCRLLAAMETLKKQNQDTNSAKANVEENLEKATNEIHDLKKEIFDYVQELTNVKREVHEQKMQINVLQKDKDQVDNELQQSKKDFDEKFAQIQQLLTEKKQLEENIAEIENNAKAYKEISEDKQRKLEIQLENKDKEIETKIDAINRLMCDVKTGAEIKFKLEDTLAEVNREIALERDAVKEREEKSKKEIKTLQDTLRAKEAEFTQHISIILELRKEKDRLQQRFQDLQQTLDNVQKELTGRRMPPVKERFVPELDDNAVMMTPSRAKPAGNESARRKLAPSAPTASTAPSAPPTSTAPSASTAPTARTVPEAAICPDSLLNMFSDSSSDDDRLNETAVKRCFAALSRGEILSRAQLASLKQRPNRQAPGKQNLQQKPQDTVATAKKEQITTTRPRKFFRYKSSETKK